MEEIEINSNNLYRTGKIIDFGTEQVLVRDKVTLQNDIATEYHTVVDGDRLDLIAYNAYRHKVEDASKYWWVIADVNLIMNPLDLSGLVGKEIAIPEILNVLLRI